MEPALAKVRTACELLEQGRPEEVVKLLEGDADEDSIVSQSILLAARGLIFERQGNAAEAKRCFEQGFRQGVPLPVLLREFGRYFKRTGRYDEAYQCYAILRNFEDPEELDRSRFKAVLAPRLFAPPSVSDGAPAPDAINAFLHGLPQAELARYSPWPLRELRNWRGLDHWFLAAIKNGLVSRFGPESAALVFAGMAGKRRGWDVATMPLTSLRDFTKAEGLVYEELVPSRDVHMPAPPVFEGQGPTGVDARTRTVFFSILEDVVISSNSNLLLAEDQALFDYQDDELERFPIDLDVDPIVFAPTDDSVTVLIEEGARSGPELEQAFPLVGVNSYAFGHWLGEFLPKVIACLDRPGFGSVPLLIDEWMPPQHREALEFFAGPDHPIAVLERGEAVRLNRLWTCSTMDYYPPGVQVSPPLDGEAFARLIARLRPRLEAIGEPAGPKRIYLTRADYQHRRLMNRREVEAWFTARGFEVLDFARLPFKEQVARIRGADVVVGPDGSSLNMHIFARPGTRIGILSNPYHLESHRSTELTCRCLGQRLLMLTGEVVAEGRDPSKSDYRIDIDALPGFLNELLQSPRYRSRGPISLSAGAHRDYQPSGEAARQGDRSGAVKEAKPAAEERVAPLESEPARLRAELDATKRRLEALERSRAVRVARWVWRVRRRVRHPLQRHGSQSSR